MFLRLCTVPLVQRLPEVQITDLHSVRISGAHCCLSCVGVHLLISRLCAVMKKMFILMGKCLEGGCAENLTSTYVCGCLVLAVGTCLPNDVPRLGNVMGIGGIGCGSALTRWGSGTVMPSFRRCYARPHTPLFRPEEAAHKGCDSEHTA